MGQRFLLRNARAENAQREIDFIERSASETEYGTWRPGEYARQYNVEDEAEYLEDTARDEGCLYLFAFTPEGELVDTCSVTFAARKARSGTWGISPSPWQRHTGAWAGQTYDGGMYGVGQGAWCGSDGTADGFHQSTGIAAILGSGLSDRRPSD